MTLLQTSWMAALMQCVMELRSYALGVWRHWTAQFNADNSGRCNHMPASDAVRRNHLRSMSTINGRLLWSIQ